jgi:hypothetical protein
MYYFLEEVGTGHQLISYTLFIKNHAWAFDEEKLLTLPLCNKGRFPKSKFVVPSYILKRTIININFEEMFVSRKIHVLTLS